MNKSFSLYQKFKVAGTGLVVMLVMGVTGWSMWEPSLSATPAVVVSAQPTFDAASSANTGSSKSSSLTWNHTVTAGVDRLLVVGVSINNSNSQTVSSITYNGLALIKAGDATNSTKARAELWGLRNPPSGTFPVVVTLSSSARFVAGATSYTGVDQTVTASAVVKVTGSNASPSVTLNSAANELVIDVVASRNTTYTLSVGSGQTQRYQDATTHSSTSKNIRGGGSTEPGASSVTMNWTLSGSTDWAIMAASVKPTSAPDTTPPVISNATATSITALAATITWSTDEPADSQVEYGLDTNYGSQTTLDPALVSSHSQIIIGLTPNTLYHYRVKSKDAAGNLAVSGDYTFTTAAPNTRPNIIVIMTDDQDTASVRVMTKLQSLITGQGVSFSNFFVSYSLCCPSRATLLTGQYANNHTVMSNTLPAGGYAKLDNTNTLALWLQSAGYFTAQIGRYLNGYGIDDTNPADGIPACLEIPPGWNEWYALPAKPQAGFDPYNHFYLNEQGQLVQYGNPPALPPNCTISQINPTVYQTDLLSQKAEDFVNRRASATDGKPFFLWINFFAPHNAPGLSLPGPVPAARHQGVFDNEPFPTAPAFNEADVSDKPGFIQQIPLFSQAKINSLATEYRRQLEALLAVDEGIEQLITALTNTNQLANTVIMFTSDNGYLLGEHRWGPQKAVVYEESIKLPLIVRGPGFMSNIVYPQLTVNVDLAPTILELAQGMAGRVQDGKSLVPFLTGNPVPWRNYVFLQSAYLNVHFSAVRDSQYVYVEHTTGEQELYDLATDPYQLTSQHNNPAYDAIKATLQQKLNILKTCVGSNCWLESASFPERSIKIPAVSLIQNYPNPFNPTTAIKFVLPRAERVQLVIFNVLGQKVATLVDNEILPAGQYIRTWEAKDVGSGVFFYQMTAGNFREMRKMILVQ